MEDNRVFESRAPWIRRKPVRHSAPLCGDPPRPVEVVARLSRRAAPGRSACRRRPVSLTDDRRVRWHRPNQINIPPLRDFLRPSRLASSFPLRRFLPSFFVFADAPCTSSHLQFAPILSEYRRVSFLFLLRTQNALSRNVSFFNIRVSACQSLEN